MEPLLTEEQAISQLTDLGIELEKIKNAFEKSSDKTLTGLLSFIEKEQEGPIGEKIEEEKYIWIKIIIMLSFLVVLPFKKYFPTIPPLSIFISL